MCTNILNIFKLIKTLNRSLAQELGINKPQLSVSPVGRDIPPTIYQS